MTENKKIFLQSENYGGDYVKKGTNCVYFFQENADGKWNNTTLTVELLEELLEIAKNNR